jgi:protein TonB
MRIDRYVHDERLTWGAAGVLTIVAGLHAAGIGGLLLARPPAVTAVLPPVFQVSLERLPPPRLPQELEPEPSVRDDAVQTPPRKTRPVPILVDTPTTNPVPPDTQVKPYERGDELLEGDPGPASPPGADVGGSDANGMPPEAPGKWKVKLRRMQPPEYPPRCLRMGIEGVVKVRVLVGEDGRPQEMTVARSSGDSGLDTAAMDAVKKWVFEPAMRNGVPVRGWAVVPIEFKLLD